MSSGKRSWIRFKNSKLHDFCYVCGRLSHLDNDCESVIESKLKKKEVIYAFGPSLRADGLKYVRNLSTPSPLLIVKSHTGSIRSTSQIDGVLRARTPRLKNREEVVDCLPMSAIGIA